MSITIYSALRFELSSIGYPIYLYTYIEVPGMSGFGWASLRIRKTGERYNAEFQLLQYDDIPAGYGESDQCILITPVEIASEDHLDGLSKEDIQDLFENFLVFDDTMDFVKIDKEKILVLGELPVVGKYIIRPESQKLLTPNGAWKKFEVPEISGPTIYFDEEAMNYALIRNVNAYCDGQIFIGGNPGVKSKEELELVEIRKLHDGRFLEIHYWNH